MQGVEAGPTSTGRQEGRNPIGATSGGPLPQLTDAPDVCLLAACNMLQGCGCVCKRGAGGFQAEGGGGNGTSRARYRK